MKTTIKHLAVALLLALAVPLMPCVATPAQADTVTVADFDSLAQAVADAGSDERTIAIAGDLEFSDTLTIPAGASITLATEGDAAVTLAGSAATANKQMIQVAEGASLTLDGNVTMDGSSSVGYVLCYGAFTMKSGTLTGCNISTSTNRLGGVTVSGESATFTLDGGTIQNTSSAYGHKGAVYVWDKAQFTMNGGSISSNSFNNQLCAAVVIDDSSFEMNGGEISGNKTDVSQISSGGGVLVMGVGWGQVTTSANAKSASFVMNGGKICNNESNRGGGVYVMGGHLNYTDLYSKAYFTMNGGEISGNTTRNYSTSSVNIVSAGGGVYVEWAGEVTMNGGSISNNSTEGMGGGVATNDAWTNYFGKNSYDSAGDRHYNELYYRDWPTIFPAAFTMNGGSITGNTAMSTSATGDQGCGGGVYVASDNVVLNAGDISGNRSGKQGGGVYVGSVPYVLTLKDVLITDNTATVIGGGVWLCPTGQIDASVNKGAALYGNSAGDAADDFAAVHTISDYTASISGLMLGGGLANWYQDGGIDATYTLGTADSSVPRFDANGDDNTPVADTTSLSGCVSIKSVPSAEAQEAAKATATLTITGNSSARGGGIGSNGGIVAGGSPDQTRELVINKEWVGSGSLPDAITVWVSIDGHRTQSVELTKADGWTSTVAGLPIDGDITIEEEVPDGWQATYQYATSADGNVTATVTNSPEPSQAEVSVSARKVWDDGNDANRPTEVRVQLYKDGVAYGEAQVLGEKNGWACTWDGLDASATWTVDEVDVPAGYRRTVTSEGNSWTITNTKDPSGEATPKSTPKKTSGVPSVGDGTGAGAAPILALAGLAIAAACVVTRRTRMDVRR